MISASEALRVILQKTVPLEKEEVDLLGVLHRFPAQDLFAPISLPPFDHSAMDGFALRWEETVGASADHPVRFRVLETIPAGNVGAHGRAPLQPKPAVRIMTGAPLPEWTDAVVPFEECRIEGDVFFISQAVKKGAHIRRAGEDVKQGEKVLESGHRIDSRSIALLAALGIGKVPVIRRPRVKILVTGNELIDVESALGGSPLPPGKIYNSNGPTLVAALQEMGIEPEAVIQSADSEETLKTVLSVGARRNVPLLDADVLITMGGVSAGDFDLIPKVFKDLGAETHFHKVAIKPGKPLLFASLEGKLIFGLPGNPVSSWVTFDRFVRPALLRMMGARLIFRIRRLAVAENDLKGSEGKEDYLRGVVEYREGNYLARPTGSQSSANLLGLARANALLFLPSEKKKILAGEAVEFEFLKEVL